MKRKTALQRIILLVFFSLLLIPFSAAVQENAKYENLTLLLAINGTLDILKKNDAAKVNWVKAELEIVPQNTPTQQILEKSFSPAWQQQNTSILFVWNEPKEEKLQLTAQMRVKTNARLLAITKKIPFPLSEEEVPSDVQQYLQETAMINYNNSAIRDLATSLAAGEDDTYLVAVIMAQWVQEHITYNLTTMTAEAAQPASWVLENKYGVCDELTNLYIALLRAVGIPARFVVGLAYSDSDLFEQQWNPHGWAEVYLPGYGWVPFDITYGQFGYVDATHIKLNDALDAYQASMVFEWYGKYANITSQGVTFDVHIEEYGNKTTFPVTMTTETYKEEVGFGSYNLLQATLKNEKGYYLPVLLSLAVPIEVSIEGTTKKTVLLKPYEEKTVFWLLYVSEGLEEWYDYSFPLIISTQTNETKEAIFRANAYSKVIGKEMLETILQNKEEEEKTYAKNMTLSCSVEKEEFYPEDIPPLTCSIKNKGNILQNLSVCFEEICEEISLWIGDQKTFSFFLQNLSLGYHMSIVTAENNEIKKSAIAEYTVLDEPQLSIRDVHYENETQWGALFSFSFDLEKNSFQDPQQILVTIRAGKDMQEISLKRVHDTKHIEEVLDTTLFRKEKTPVTITVTYADAFGKQWQEEETIIVTLSGISFWKKVQNYLYHYLQNFY